MAEVPLAARLRPRTPAEFVGQTHLVGPGPALTQLIEKGALPSLILWGPAGSGKTTLAHRLAAAVGAHLMRLSAVNSGVADARKVMDGARGGLFKTVLFVDEVHRWSKAQQDVLLPAVEEGTVTLIGATTENPYFSLNTPLLSRCLLMRLEPLSPDDVAALIRRALDDAERGLGGHGLAIDDDALEHLVTIAGGDARLNLAQATIYLARAAKSNSVYTAISAALEDAASADPVPAHLRDASYPGAKKLGHGKGYVYPHDEPGHWTEQDYRPVRYHGNRYYEPSEMGEDTKDWTPGGGPAGPSRRDPSTG